MYLTKGDFLGECRNDQGSAVVVCNLPAALQKCMVGVSTTLKIVVSNLLRPLDSGGPFRFAAAALVVTAGSVSRSEDLPNLA